MSSKTKACNKVKNPCKFCLQQVDKKTGLQCQGACKKWAHFKCLNYTPGKISDIKAGIIKVTCPCPDCETTQLKEFLTNPPFTCSNTQCPANTKPKCESASCPSNNSNNNPKIKNQRQESRPVPSYPSSKCPSLERSAGGCSNEAVPCPNKCPSSRSHPREAQARPPTPPRGAKKKTPPATGACFTPAPCMTKDKSDSKKCPKTNKGSPKKPVQKSPSLSLLSQEDSQCKNKDCSSSNSDSRVKTKSAAKNDSMVNALEEMCGTVGMLSDQLKDLMCKLIHNV